VLNEFQSSHRFSSAGTLAALPGRAITAMAIGSPDRKMAAQIREFPSKA
jgi:hypothetical protein